MIKRNLEIVGLICLGVALGIVVYLLIIVII